MNRIHAMICKNHEPGLDACTGSPLMLLYFLQNGKHFNKFRVSREQPYHFLAESHIFSSELLAIWQFSSPKKFWYFLFSGHKTISQCIIWCFQSKGNMWKNYSSYYFRYSCTRLGKILRWTASRR